MKPLALVIALLFPLEVLANAMCGEPDFLHCGETVTNELSWGDCRTDDEGFVDSYQKELPAGTVVRLMAFAGLATDELRLQVFDFHGVLLSEAAGTGGVSLVLTVPENAEGIGIDISTPRFLQASYHLRMTCEQADGSNCEPATLSCDAGVSGELTTYDCPTSNSYEDRYEVTLRAGETIDLHAIAAFGLTLEIGRRDENGTYEGVVRAGESDSTLRFTAEESGTYEVRIGSFWPLLRGAYELDVDCVAPPGGRRRGVRH